MKVLTYLDSGVLIAAACGEVAIAEKAMAYIDDPNREFASSILVKLEVLPKSIYYNKPSKPFYEAFFSETAAYANTLDENLHDALIEAETFGLGGIDALHISTAKRLKAKDFVTSEKPTKPMFRTTSIKVISINA